MCLVPFNTFLTILCIGLTVKYKYLGIPSELFLDRFKSFKLLGNVKFIYNFE